MMPFGFWRYSFLLRPILALMPTTVPMTMSKSMTKSELTKGVSMEAQPSQWNIDSILSPTEWEVALETLSVTVRKRFTVLSSLGPHAGDKKEDLDRKETCESRPEVEHVESAEPIRFEGADGSNGQNGDVDEES